MISWFSIVSNGFWVAGLAVILAALSYYYWLSTQTSRPLGQTLGSPPFQGAAAVGLLLVGIGLILTAGGIWQLIPAVVLVLACAAALVGLFRARSNIPPSR